MAGLHRVESEGDWGRFLSRAASKTTLTEGLSTVASKSQLELEEGRATSSGQPLTGDPLLGDNLASIIEPGRGKCPLTKVVATVGANARSVEVLEEMLHAGMSVARVDMSWGSREYHQETVDNLREAMKRTKKMCAVMLDTKGPETQARMAPPGRSEEAPVIDIEAGMQVTLTATSYNDPDNFPTATAHNLPVNNPKLPQMVTEGDEVFIGLYLASGFEGGNAFLEVVSTSDWDVVCRAVTSSRLSGELLTVHIRGMEDSINCLNDDDVEDLAKFAAPNAVEFVSLSFTTSAEDVERAVEVLKANGCKATKIIAKVEGQRALSQFESIAQAADGVMLSRGNLGLELNAEKVFLAQKYALRVCNQLGKPSIVTRVVDTLVESTSPTRAEATDVANACLDGTDAILLGAETIRGLYPANAIRTVLSICAEAEKVFNADHFFRQSVSLAHDEQFGMQQREALASSAVRAAYKVDARIIIVFTQTGNTAHLVAKYHPYQPVLCVVVPSVSRDSTQWVIHGGIQARQTLLPRGLLPLLAHFNISTSQSESPNGHPSALSYALRYAQSLDLVSPGDRVVICQKIGSSSVVKVADA